MPFRERGLSEASRALKASAPRVFMNYRSDAEIAATEAAAKAAAEAEAAAKRKQKTLGARLKKLFAGA